MTYLILLESGSLNTTQFRDMKELEQGLKDNPESFEDQGILAIIDFSARTCKFIRTRTEINVYIDTIS